MKNSNYKTGTRMLALILAIIIALTMIPAMVFATEWDGTGEEEGSVNDNPFTDVGENAWYYEYVMRTYGENLFAGTSATTFSPNTPMTRAMLVTVLYRMENEPDVSDVRIPFTDVKENAWYTSGIKWAYYKGIVFGTSTTVFAPTTKISREQMVTMMHRYAVATGYANTDGYWDTQQEKITATFSDANKISYFARESMAWAYQNNLIAGKSSTELDPQGNATRAEVAAVLCRYLDYTTDAHTHIHVYRAVETVPPNCTENGCTHYKCECGADYTGSYISALGHNFGEWVVVEQSSATQNGLETRTCSRCKIVEKKMIPMISPSHQGHPIDDSGIIMITGPTCTGYVLNFIDDRNVRYAYAVIDCRTWGTVYCSVDVAGMLVQYSNIYGEMQSMLLCMPDKYSYQACSMALYLQDDGTIDISIKNVT